MSDVAIDQAYQFEYGPRYESRLIVTESLQTASSLIHRIRAGESFIDLAITDSIDASRSQGGYLGAISVVDPTYPKVIRTTIADMNPGEVSDPIALDRGFALLKLDRIIEPQAQDIDEVKPLLVNKVKQRIERMLMARLARSMLSEADIIVLDPVLDASWEDHRQALLRANQ